MRRVFLFLPLVSSAVVQAQTLDLNELTSEALKNNRKILAAQKSYEAARQRPTQERDRKSVV